MKLIKLLKHSLSRDAYVDITTVNDKKDIPKTKSHDHCLILFDIKTPNIFGIHILDSLRNKIIKKLIPIIGALGIFMSFNHCGFYPVSQKPFLLGKTLVLISIFEVEK